MENKPYFQILRDYVKLAGEEIAARANEIVPENAERISDLSIWVSFDQSIGSIPTIEWTMKVTPDMNKLSEEDFV